MKQFISSDLVHSVLGCCWMVVW